MEPNRGTVIVFSNSQGSVALDGTDGHSPFSGALLNHIGEQGVDFLSLVESGADRLRCL
jgi:hypothetical protein